MTERHHPNVDQARALSENPRFLEWLDSSIETSRSNSWMHTPYTARLWLERQCGVDSLGRLGTDRQAADRLHDIARRFAVWDRNEELAV